MLNIKIIIVSIITTGNVNTADTISRPAIPHELCLSCGEPASGRDCGILEGLSPLEPAGLGTESSGCVDVKVVLSVGGGNRDWPFGSGGGRVV